MGDPILRRTISISHSGGNFTCKRIESFKPDHDISAEVAKAIEGPIGYHFDDKGGSITLSVFAETGRPEVDYESLMVSKEQFLFTTQHVDGAGNANGRRLQYRNVIVEKVGAPTENNGKHMIEVNCKFLGFRIIR